MVALVLVLGMVVTGAFAHRVKAKPGVFWADVNVLFLAPSSAVNPNTLTSNGGGLVTVAGAVARMVDPDVSDARVVSPDVTIADQGIRNGYAVTLPNDGGQWANNFDRPLLDVQVVGPSYAEVGATMRRLVTDIDASLATIQDQAHVAKANLIHTSLSPSQPQIFYLTGRTHRALIVTVLLGLALTIAAAAATSRALRRPRPRSARKSLDGAR